MSAEIPVLRLITRLNIGGPARQALLLSGQLGWPYRTVLATGTPPRHEGELTDPSVPLVRVPLVRAVSPRHDVHGLSSIRRLIREMRPRIVHTHTAKAGTIGRIAARGASAPGIRTVHTFHGHVLDGYFRPIVARAFLETEKRLARQTDVLIAISPEIRDELVELGIGQPGQYEVIPLGFDLRDHFALTPETQGTLRARLGLPHQVPLVGVVGRLAPIKDHETLLNAMATCPNAHLAVLGDGELRHRLEARVRTMNLASRVHFVGWWMDIPSALADLDVVVLSSRNEGTPVSLIEALAGARPVVSTDVGGVRSVVRDGVTGILVPPGDSQALSRAITVLLSDPQRRRQMGLRGREDVRARFSHHRLLRDIRQLYQALTSPGLQ